MRLSCGHEPVVEGDLVGVHAAVADGVDGPTLHLAAVVVGELEAVAVALRLGHDEHRQAPVAERPVGVGAGEQQQHVGAGPERAPRLDAVDAPALGAVVEGVAGGRGLDAGDVGAEVGLGHGDRTHDLGGGQLREPVLLLLLGAALLDRPGHDLGTGDERTADAERAA